MRILVLGGGLQGKTVAADLVAALPDARVDVADIRPGAGTVEADLSDARALPRLLAGCDLAVGALPARLGFGAMRAAIEARRSFVDLSFCPEDALSLDADARRAGVTVLPDCGLAPGLSNFVVGRALADGPADEIRIHVGGIAQDASRPFGYVVTWSVDDLFAEYTRPARVRRGGKIAEVPALGGLEAVDFPGVGRLEAFHTDGLRSLLRLDVREMEEKTLRWPGHVEAIRPLLEQGTFVETIRRACAADPPRDLVAFRVAVRRGTRWEETTLVDRHDGRRTAMTRTTALTCAAVARLVAQGGVAARGVVPLEALGRDAARYAWIAGALAERGVKLRQS